MLRDDIAEDDPLAGYWMEGDSLAPPCQTDDVVIAAILEVAALSPSSYLFDLGCGDGRICTEASIKYGCRSCGVEIEHGLVAAFRQRIQDQNLSSLVTAISGDLCEVDISAATVIVLYLLPDAIELIRDRLMRALNRGVVLICHTWGLRGLAPTKRLYCGEWNNVTLLYYDAGSTCSNHSVAYDTSFETNPELC